MRGLDEIPGLSAFYHLDARGFLVSRVVLAEPQKLIHAQAGVRILRKLAQGQRLPLLVDARHGTQLEPNARSYYIEQAPTYATCIAILVNSGVTRIAGNFFLAIMAASKRSLPTRIFEEESKAVLWLLSDEK